MKPRCKTRLENSDRNGGEKAGSDLGRQPEVHVPVVANAIGGRSCS